MTWKLEKKSFRWKYLEALEAPRVVHVRTTEMLSKENLYAQVTVRLLTRQVTSLRICLQCFFSSFLNSLLVKIRWFTKNVSEATCVTCIFVLCFAPTVKKLFKNTKNAQN